jgi:ABC-type hemin transport system substrate-binding protein
MWRYDDLQLLVRLSPLTGLLADTSFYCSRAVAAEDSQSAIRILSLGGDVTEILYAGSC